MKTNLLAAILCAGCLSAQAVHTVPAAYANAEAPAMTVVPGIGISLRKQILIEDIQLATMQGRRVEAIRFRRDSTSQRALDGGSAHVVVRLGTAPRHPAQAVSAFEANIVSPIEVFRGNITIPAAPAVSGYVGWATDQYVEVPLTTPFDYSGGHLCLDIEGTVAGAAFWWPLDAASDTTSGTVLSEGRACGPYAGVNGVTATVPALDLVVGETAVFTFRGRSGAPAFLMFGVTTLPLPLDLALIGSPGCELRVDAFAATPAAIGPEIAGPEFGGWVNLLLDIPPSHYLLGAEFVAQWTDLGPPVHTSNTLRCRLAGSAPASGRAVVYREPGATQAVVHFTTVPVVGFVLAD